MSNAGYVQLPCKHCGSYFRSMQRKRSTKCGNCGQSNYVPANATWQGPGTPEELAQSTVIRRRVGCPKCGHTWLSTQRIGGPTHCSACGASIRLREASPNHPSDPQTRATRVSGQRTPADTQRRPRTRRDLTPGSAALVGKEYAKQLRRERTEKKGVERQTKKAASEERLRAGRDGWATIFETIAQIAGVHTPTHAPTPTRHVPSGPTRQPSTKGRGKIMRRAPGDASTCWGLTDNGERCGAPFTRTIDGLPYCNKHTGYQWVD